MTFDDLLKDLDLAAPFRLAQPWDRVGPMTGRGSKEIRKVLISLDASHGALQKAIQAQCDAWVTHHPLIWDPLKSLADPNDSVQTNNARLKLLLKCVEVDLAVAACHTNWDAAEGGVNDALASELGLSVTDRFGPGTAEERLKMVVTLPLQSLSQVVEAASAAGAGVIGRYSQCAFFWEGQGTFLPMDGSSPRVGQIGRPASVQEARVEMVLPARLKPLVDSAVRRVHPYEEPALDWLVCQSEIVGRLGVLTGLSTPLTLASFATHVQRRLRTATRTYGDIGTEIRRAALVGGAGSGFWKDALGKADVLVTGEVRQNDALEAVEAGLCMIEAGHFATEQPGMGALASYLSNAGWETLLYEPKPGLDGSPFSLNVS